jgi:hypothetical protein
VDRYQQKRSAYGDASVTYQLLAATDLSSTPHKAIAGKAGYTIYLQKVQISVTTGGVAKTVTVQDNTTPTVVPYAELAASAAVGPYLWDFGPDGVPVAESAEVDIANSGAGVAAIIHIEAYQKATGINTVLIGNQVGGGTPGTGGSEDP